MKDLVKNAMAGDRRSIAKLITLVENEEAGALEAMREVHRYSGGAYVIGITGVAGSGKSTLISLITKELRAKNFKVGIIAIDPTSPFSGGAVLGDRVRMLDLTNDNGVFIRSMGTHGLGGGLSSAVHDVIQIMDAAGSHFVIVETVGVGQDEVDIAKFADTTVVVTVPGLGDYIQTIKAGIMEIGDILVVNKSDRPGVDETVGELESMLDLGGSHSSRRPPIIKTSAKMKEGIESLTDEILIHKKYLEDTVGTTELKRHRLESALIELTKRYLTEKILKEFETGGEGEKIIKKILAKKTDLRTAAKEILEKITIR